MLDVLLLSQVGLCLHSIPDKGADTFAFNRSGASLLALLISNTISSAHFKNGLYAATDVGLNITVDKSQATSARSYARNIMQQPCWAHYPNLVVPTKLVVFTEMPAFMAEPSPESDEAWRGLSMGHSLIELNKNEVHAMDIGDGLPTTNPATELYGVSWTHQLHCLAILCAGDMALEGRAEETMEESLPRINGFGAVHQCRDMLG
ncbi:hypothetical protein LZ30DRAFT_686684 [Colletotrichum cereale]|nr:hypothetical protein LZ30DRAFT_686684 [Colletotrichum cereale]